MNWVALIVALLKLVNNLYSWAHDRGLIQQGKDEQLKAEALALAKRVGVAKDIDARFAKMTDKEVEKVLDKDFRD